MNTILQSSLEVEIPAQVVVDVQNVLDWIDKLDLNKSQGQVGLHPVVLKEFQDEIMGLQLIFTFKSPATSKP
jgi:hypothetical protein